MKRGARFESRPNWFPFFAEAWQFSEKIALMTAEEEVVYLHLLLHAWTTDTCSLPDDDSALEKLARLNGRSTDVQRALAVVRNCLIQHPSLPGRLISPRLYEERLKAEAIWAQKRNAGINSGKKRTNKSTDVQRALDGRSTGVERMLNHHITSHHITSSEPSSVLPTNPEEVRKRGSSKPSDQDQNDRNRITLEDLSDPARLQAHFQGACRAGLVKDSTAGLRSFFAMATHCLREGNNPVAMFCANVKAGSWAVLTDKDDDQAVKLMRGLGL